MIPPTTSATEALENAVEESRREYDKNGPGAVGEISVLPILLGALGVVALAISIVYRIGVYSVTEYPTGIGSIHRLDAITGRYSRDEWVVSMLDDYDEWSDKIAEEIETNAGYLELVQFSLSFGVIALLVSASMIALKTAYGVRPLITFVIALFFAYTIRTYLGNTD